jgi:hypothetical protein
MKTPWTNKTGTAKLVAIFSTSLGIAVGLCGINFFAVIRFVPLSGPGRSGSLTAHDRFVDALGTLLTIAGVLELVVIFGSIVALIALAVNGVIRRRDEGN